MLILSSACASTQARTEQSRLPPAPEVYARLPKLALLPVSTAGLDAKGARAVEISEHFYHLAYYALEKTYRFQMLSRRTTFQVLLRDREPHLEEIAPDDTTVLQRAQTLETPYLARCQLFRFDERQGDRFGVNRPASVGFRLDLIRAADGKILWSQNYLETQKSLSEDLFSADRFFERRGQWVTADELARSALDRMIAQMLTSIEGS